MSEILRIASLPFVAFCLASCLRTRAELQEAEQKKQLSTQVQQLAQSKADTQVRVDELEEQNRNLYGKIEELQNQISQREKLNTDKVGQADEKLKAYEEALAKMQADMKGMEAEMTALRELQVKSGTTSAKKDETSKESATAKSKEATQWIEGEEAFAKKDWKKAVLGYQGYRENYPKGKRYAQATYKIGVSFQELGLKDEAKSFFQEVVEKFPKSSEATQAKSRLKNLK